MPSPEPATDFEGLLRTLVEGAVDFIVVGGVAAKAQGSARYTLGLEKLIAVKRAAGRPKDLEAIAELEAIWEERRKRGL